MQLRSIDVISNVYSQNHKYMGLSGHMVYNREATRFYWYMSGDKDSSVGILSFRHTLTSPYGHGMLDNNYLHPNHLAVHLFIHLYLSYTFTPILYRLDVTVP